jgi:CRP-like cAMP-binding protein
MSLLFNQPRNATVIAVMTTELLEPGQSTFEFILKEYPLVRAQAVWLLRRPVRAQVVIEWRAARP